jgi:putative spermidine/putrescine transport system ATP-binding protein
MMWRVPRAELRARVEQALDLVQLRAHGDKLPGQLSGGQQQRVAIARAIAINPPLVLMDEPLSNLDAKLRLEMRHEIRRIHHEVRRATIYVTHDQDEALSLADRIVVMQDGMVQQIGMPQDLYARPANLNVARFMGYRNVLRFDTATPVQRRLVRLNRGEASLLATLQTDAAPGPVTVVVRPEEIGTGDGPNGLEGRVTEAEYCGRDYLIDVETPLGKLHARVPAAAQPGDGIRLVLPVERVLAFPDATAAPVPVAAE